MVVRSVLEQECALKKFQQDNYVQLYKRISIYKELDYSCIHVGKTCSSIFSGQRPNTR